MPPAECDRAKEDRDYRRQKFGPDRDSTIITSAHKLHRCVSERHVDYETNKPRPAAFDQPGMSVFVEGPGFSPLDLDAILQQKTEWIAIASIDAAEFINNVDFYNFELLHDPYADEHGYQHDNHAIVVCKKNTTKGTRMQLAAEWTIPPPGAPPESMD